MVHRNTAKRCGIYIAILLGVVLLAFCVSGVSAADPAVNITLTTTPQPPTDFEITQTGIDSINITWAKGLGANITIVRSSTNGYPWSIFDGTAVYSGNGTSVAVDGLDLTTTTYYYRAWSQNAYGTSAGYAQDGIGVAAEEGIDVSALIDWLNTFIGGPMGIVNMLFIVAMVGFAFWKKGWIRILLAICIIIWGAFAMKYDVKVAAPLLAIGTVLFFMGVLNRITESKKARENESV